MTPGDVLAGALAAALLGGPWTQDAMVERLREVIGEERAWMRFLARATMFAHREPPDDVEPLAQWLWTRRAFGDAMHDGDLIVRRYPIAASPRMAPAPFPVPALATTIELAAWLGITGDALDVLADRRAHWRTGGAPRLRHYDHTWIAKPSGGSRLIEAPRHRLKTVQRAILDGILAHVPPHEAAHGFRAEHSLVGFAAPHVGRAVVVRVDLQAFFTSVFAGRVFGIFATLGYPTKVARTLTTLCTHVTPVEVIAVSRDAVERMRLRAPHLPQGAPTSGALANLAAYRLDVRLAGLARALGGRYTRYADDLVISGDRELVRAAPSLVARIGAIAIEEGFTLNYRKTRVMTASGRQRITGIVVNERLSSSRVDVERLRAILHNCTRTGPAAQNRDGHPDFRAHLLGRISWIAQLDPDKGARLRASFDRIAWPGEEE